MILLLGMLYYCAQCMARAQVKAAWCTVCGAVNSFLPAMWTPAAEVLADTATMTARELHRITSEFLDLAEDLARVFGRLPAKPFVVAIFGPPGSLKSTTMLRLASWLCQVWGPCVYASLEEAFSPSLCERLRRLEIVDESLIFTAANDLGVLLDIAEKHHAKALFIDSLTESCLSADDVARIVRETGLAVVFTLHATKKGDAGGRLSLLHVADTVVRLEDGRFCREKCRYSETAEGEL